MAQMIFVNLPVSDLPRSMAFYEEIGAKNNPQFTDESAAMMSFSEEVSVMLLTHKRFADFTPKTIPDAKTTAQVLLALSRDSRAAVDEITDRAAAEGVRIDPTPPQDFGWMYGRSFEDPDGHIWEAAWMDVEAATAATAEAHPA
jgi:predicted lactoylglutathione lyase